MAGKSEGVVKGAELRCENCGAPWEMRGFATTKTIACEHCGSVFDIAGEAWQLVQRVEGAYQAKPAYALGTRGKLDGVEWEVIGWAERSVVSWGTRYSWEEHLLYNPYEGFCFLILQDGHFVLVSQVPGVPSTGVNLARYTSRTYKHFSTAEANVDEVLGEFPWEMRRGDVATATDYVDPPNIISSEESRGELVWSSGRYLPREEVLAAFGKPTRTIRAAHGIHPCQPNPHKALTTWMLRAFGIAVATWLVVTLGYFGMCANQQVWAGQVPPEGVLIDEVVLETTPSNGTLEVKGNAAVSNNWVFLSTALIHPATEKAYHVGLEISYYRGSDWSEGSQSSSALVRGIPNGKYILQVTHDPASKYKGPVNVTITRDVPMYRFPCCAFILLLIVPGFLFAQSRAFEQKRWSESDHAG